MSSTKIKSFYEGFHKTSTQQNKIPNLSSFTYRIIIPVIDKYVTKTNIKILDYGCGVGSTAIYLANKKNFVIGYDISEIAIKAAIQFSKNTNLQSNTKFTSKIKEVNKIKNSSLDLILCLEVIEHVKEEDELIKLFYSKLKKGGRVILSTPSNNAPLYKLGLLKKFDNRVGHLRRYDKNRLKKIFNENKLTIEDIIENEGIVRNLLFTIEPFGKILKLIKWKLVDWVTIIDNLTVKIFSGSDFIVIAQK